jgi:hypothetical protein
VPGTNDWQFTFGIGSSPIVNTCPSTPTVGVVPCPALQGNPAGLLARLTATARTNMTNFMGPNDPANTAPSTLSGPCPTGWCHIDRSHPISNADAYGAGIVNATAAVGP